MIVHRLPTAAQVVLSPLSDKRKLWAMRVVRLPLPANWRGVALGRRWIVVPRSVPSAGPTVAALVAKAAGTPPWMVDRWIDDQMRSPD